MSTFVLVPGAGGDAWYWHRVVPLLEQAGHTAVAVDLPAADPAAGWEEYAAAVRAAAPAGPAVLVAQSMGGFTAPLAAEGLDVERIVLVNAMVPLPGETGGEWWAATGQPEAAEAAARAAGRAEAFTMPEDFFHDVPDEVREEAFRRGEPDQSDTPFARPWPLTAWPDVPTSGVAGADDRLFPPDFQRRVARERLGIDLDVVPGGHLVALSRPAELVDHLLAGGR